jgi:hypothetical protein
MRQGKGGGRGQETTNIFFTSPNKNVSFDVRQLAHEP